MPADEFLNSTAAIDLEINESGELYAIGALFGDQVFAKDGRFDRLAALCELDQFLSCVNSPVTARSAPIVPLPMILSFPIIRTA